MVGIQLRSKVGEKGQVVIPKPLRDQFNLSKETELVFEVEGDKIAISRAKTDLALLEEIFNAFPKRKLPKNIDWRELYYSQYKFP